MKSSAAIFAVSLLAWIIGCAAPLEVPRDAELIYYGPAGNIPGTPPGQPGRVYIFDESANQVVSVFMIAAGQPYQLNKFDRGHNYRVYFQPVSPAATRPAQ